MCKHIDANLFLNVVRPGLQSTDPVKLAHDVACHWQPADICSLLHHPQVDVRRTAAVVLGLVGDMALSHCLAEALHDSDEQVNQMAEHGLWSIWFRSCKPQAACLFRQGISLIDSEDYAQALELFKAALRIDPKFAEAHNQCAIAHFFMDQWEKSIECCKEVIKLVPEHFGAISNMGHCHMQLGHLDQALYCYRWSLRINPRMPAIAGAVERIDRQLRDTNDSSGIFPVGAMGA